MASSSCSSARSSAAGAEHVAEVEIERALVDDDVGLAVVIDDFFFALPVLALERVLAAAQIVEVEHQRRRALAQKVRGRRGQMGLCLGPLSSQLRAQNAEEGLADVANDLVLSHRRTLLNLLGITPEVRFEDGGVTEPF